MTSPQTHTQVIRRIAVTLAASAAVALAACGSGEDNGASSSVTPELAKTRIEGAAQLRLAADPIPEEAREQGLRAAFSNSATAVKDKQIVALFVMEDADVADEVSDMVRGTAPKSAKLIVDGEVMVVYASAGENHAAAVEKAVKAL